MLPLPLCGQHEGMRGIICTQRDLENVAEVMHGKVATNLPVGNSLLLALTASQSPWDPNLTDVFVFELISAQRD